MGAMELNSRFKITSWDEKTLHQLTGDQKITLASVGNDIEGDVTGECRQELVMYYRPDGTASVLGLLHISGSVAGRTGSFAVESVGGYDGTVGSGDLRVIPGSGTGELSQIRGTGASRATSEDVTCVLTVDLE